MPLSQWQAEEKNCELRPADSLEAQLARRLGALGLRHHGTIRTHTNRSVMLSLSSRGTLRLHRGYAHAPDRVLAAIVRFLDARLSRSDRKAAEREFLAFPVEEFAPPSHPRRRARPRPGDAPLIARLTALHAELNRRHFGGRLSPIPLRLSTRMRRRLGEVSVDIRTGNPLEIALNRRHVLQHPWSEVEHTMLHEMIHQWQAENGLPVDHRAGFRRKAEEVGVGRGVGRRSSAAPAHPVSS